MVRAPHVAEFWHTVNEIRNTLATHRYAALPPKARDGRWRLAPGSRVAQYVWHNGKEAPHRTLKGALGIVCTWSLCAGDAHVRRCRGNYDRRHTARRMTAYPECHGKILHGKIRSGDSCLPSNDLRRKIIYRNVLADDNTQWRVGSYRTEF